MKGTYSIDIPAVITEHPLWLGSYLELTLQMLKSFDSFCAIEDYLTRMELVDDKSPREAELFELIKAEFKASFK